MESTGVYWKPIVNLLESEDIEFLVVNAQHIKSVPGRKTDVKDEEWIARMLFYATCMEWGLQEWMKSLLKKGMKSLAWMKKYQI